MGNDDPEPTAVAANLESVDNEDSCNMTEFRVSDELYRLIPVVVDVPFGSHCNMVLPLIVLLWNATLLATVALLKSPMIRCDDPENRKLPAPMSNLVIGELLPTPTFPLNITSPMLLVNMLTLALLGFCILIALRVLIISILQPR